VRIKETLRDVDGLAPVAALAGLTLVSGIQLGTVTIGPDGRQHFDALNRVWQGLKGLLPLVGVGLLLLGHLREQEARRLRRHPGGGSESTEEERSPSRRQASVLVGVTDASKADTPGASEPPLLEVKDLKIYYPIHSGLFMRHTGDVKAVDGVSFSIRPGETLGLVGESGCGKTTVGKGIMRLVNITSGQLNFRRRSGEVIDLVPLTRSELRPLRAEVQMIYQDPYSSLNPRWSVLDIVAEPLTVHQPELSRAEREEKVAWLLEKVGLTGEQAHRYPHEFSGGQRQRVGVARALATNPALILADEPVSALDVSIQAQVVNLLQDLQEEFGLAYLFIAHDLSVVEHISHRIAVMYLGHMCEIGPGRSVYESPIHPYARALLSAVPLPDPDLERPDRIRLEGEVPSPLRKPSGCPFRTRCPLAEPSCAEEVPELVEVEPERFVACPVVAKSG
jgi:oligopeptide transport system ATP-binding protein